MAFSIDNQKLVKRLKHSLRNHFPGFWEQIVRYVWELRTKYSILEPLIFRQLRNVSAHLGHGTPVPAGKKILFFQTRSNAPHLSWAGTMAMALAARGHRPVFFGCSRELSTSCNNANYPDGLSNSRCRTCYVYTRRFFELSSIQAAWMGEYVDRSDRRQAEELIESLERGKYETFEYNGIPLGKIVRHSVGHYLRTGSIGNDQLSRDVYRKFLVNSILVADASQKVLDKYDPDVVVMLCGLFMPEHVMMELAHVRGKRVVVYEIAMLAQDAIMMQHDRPIDYDDKESWAKYSEIALSSEQNQILDNYLFERSQGRMSVVNYWPEKEDDERKIGDALGVDRKKPTAVLFPNITWDSALFEKDISFKGMFDWLDQSIEYFLAHPEYQLIVRAHPAEVILPGSLRESVITYIKGRYPALPKNIILVPPESKISSYALMDMSQCGLVYASSTAMELGVRGIPVVVAGEVHFRKKGFTIDIDDANAYVQILDGVLEGNVPLSKEEIVDKARKYAYFAFFRASIPFEKVHLGEGDQPIFTYEDISSLLPGKDKGLDIVCDGIINGTPFIFE